MSDSNKDKNDVQLSPEELISRGKRDLLCADISRAVDSFQKACRLIAEKNGDLHDDLAMPNFFYGTALLELSRTENHFFGESIEPLSPKEAVEPNEAGETKCVENLPEPADTSEPVTSEHNVINGDNDVDKCLSENVETAEESDDEEDTDGNVEVSTLQLAWEVMEVAKKIFMKHDDAEHQLKVADCLEKLAEIGIEKEDNDQAVTDLLECLEIRMRHSPDSNRLIAETHFQLGVAYSMAKNNELADEAFESSLKSLKKHKSFIQTQIRAHQADSTSQSSEILRLQSELKEVSELIFEVAERKKEAAGSNQLNEKASVPIKSPNGGGPVHDISHLIKKKRHETQKSPIESDAKRTKIDNGSTSVIEPKLNE